MFTAIHGIVKVMGSNPSDAIGSIFIMFSKPAAKYDNNYTWLLWYLIVLVVNEV